MTDNIYKAKVSNLVWLNERDLEIEFELIEPSEFVFTPGQYITLKINSDLKRHYSIASNSSIKNKFSIIAAVAHDGDGSNFLKSLKEGTEVTFEGPYGNMSVQNPDAKEHLFIATGTGLSSFISMLYELAQKNPFAIVRILHGVRHESERFYLEQIEEFSKTFSDFDFKLCVSQPKDHWEGITGRVTGFIEVNDVSDLQVYMCGHPEMISDVREILEGKGVPAENFNFQKYKQEALRG